MAARGDFGNEFLAMTWSLAVEEQFYLFLPLLVRRSSPQRLPLNFVFFVSFPLILRVMLGSGGFYGFVMTPWRLDSLFLGALLAVIVRSPRVFDWLKARLAWIKGAFGVMLLLFVYSSMTEELGSLDHLFGLALFYVTLTFLSLADKTGFLARFFRNSFLRSLGVISYGIYILHQLVNGVLHDLFFHRLPAFRDTATILVTLLAFLLTYLTAQGTYHAFEKRFIAHGHRHLYATPTGHDVQV